MRIIRVLIFIISIFLGFKICGLKFDISAQEKVESANYRIVFPNLNSGAGVPTSTNYNLNTTVGQGVAGQFSSTGYKTKAGFQYINSIIPFSFLVSDIQKNFGVLTPDSPSTSTSTITVSAGGAGGYSVKASENNPLKTADTVNAIIDTLCDTSCDETTAASWTSNVKYGFGFNMSGDDVPADFTTTDYFRQFSDKSNAEADAVIMNSVNVGTSRTSTITFKINVGSIQPAGTYQNIITFTAIPSY